MQKRILITVVVVLLIAVLLGVYFIFVNYNTPVVTAPNQTPKETSSPNIFKIEGMEVEILKQGSGNQVKEGDTVTVHYVITSVDGQKFDSSFDRDAPYLFPVRENDVIKGLYLGTLGMKVGEKRKLTIPPALAYGSSGFGSVPANATIIYEIELLAINEYSL